MSTVSAEDVGCSKTKHPSVAPLSASQQVLKEGDIEKHSCALRQPPAEWIRGSFSEQAEDAFFESLLISKMYLRTISSAFEMLLAFLANSSRRQQVLSRAAKLLPKMVSDWQESDLRLVAAPGSYEETIPRAAAVCQAFEIIVANAQLKTTTLDSLIGSLLCVCKDVMLPDYLGGDSIQHERKSLMWRESLDRKTAGLILVDIFTVLIDFERRRIKATMPSTAETCDLAVPVLMSAISNLTKFPEQQHALMQCLSEYVYRLFTVNFAVKREVTSQKLAVMLTAWNQCCLRFLGYHVGAEGTLLATSGAGNLAGTAKLIVDVYSNVAGFAAWLSAAQPGIEIHPVEIDTLLATLPAALKLWSCIRKYEEHTSTQPLPNSYEDGRLTEMQVTIGLLQTCDTNLIRAMSSQLIRTTTFSSANGAPHTLLETTLKTLVRWAEEPAPLGETEEALRTAADMVCGALNSIVRFLVTEQCDHNPALLFRAAQCAVLMLATIASYHRAYGTLVRDIVHILDKILGQFNIVQPELIEIFDEDGLVESLWSLLSEEMEVGSTPADTEAYATDLCEFLHLLGVMMPCLVARILLLGDENRDAMYYWPDIDTSLERAIGSSYDNSSVKREVTKFGIRLAEIKKSCKCWENSSKPSKQRSFPTPKGGARLDDANSDASPSSQAAIAYLMRELGKVDRKWALKAAASKSKMTTTASTSTKSASSGPSNPDLGVSNMASPATPTVITAVGDAATANVASNAAKPFGQSQSMQTDSAQRKKVAQHPAVRAKRATPAASDTAGNSRLAQMASADAAMASLLLEEAALEAAANNKAAKMARKRARKKASKAAASDSKVADSPAISMASAASEEQASDPRPHGPNAAPSGAGDTDVADDGSLSTEPGQSESRRTKYADWMLCPITQELFRDPVVCTDGFSYERAAAVSWLENNNTSFVTGERLLSKDVVPNLALRSRLRAVT